MLVYSVPARYLPELEAAIGSTIRQIRCDIKLRELGPGAHYVTTDDSLKGSVTVVVTPSESPAVTADGHVSA